MRSKFKPLIYIALPLIYFSPLQAQESGKRLDFTSPVVGDFYPVENVWGCSSHTRPDILLVLSQVLDSFKSLPGALLRIEVHSDCRASEEYNQRLTQARADSLKTGAVGLGFPARRLEAVGMGESMPLLPHCTCDLTDPGNRICTEEEHQQNRRMLIRVVGSSHSMDSADFSWKFPVPGQSRQIRYDPEHPGPVFQLIDSCLQGINAGRWEIRGVGIGPREWRTLRSEFKKIYPERRLNFIRMNGQGSSFLICSWFPE